MANWQENRIERSRELSLRLREIVATAFAGRNLPDAVEVLESVERRWPVTVEVYRDEKGMSLPQKLEQELIFGAWRRVLVDFSKMYHEVRAHRGLA